MKKKNGSYIPESAEEAEMLRAAGLPIRMPIEDLIDEAYAEQIRILEATYSQGAAMLKESKAVPSLNHIHKAN